MSQLRVCVIMPAYNEAKSIGSVLEIVAQHMPGATIVVINDGSLDATSSLARQANVEVIDLPFNLGIGGAVQTGLKYARAHDFDAAVEIDADGQHNAEYSNDLLKVLQETQSDMVIGSRFIGKTRYRASLLRRGGIFIFSLLIRLVTGSTVYDSTSGFRAYSKRAIAYLSRHYPSDFPEPESIVMLLKRGFKVREVSVEMSPRREGTSSLRGDFSWRAAYFVLSNSIAILVSALKTYGR